eukprot:477043_1
MGLFDCKSILNVILASIVAFYVIRDYKSRKVDIFSIGATTTINAETAHKKLIEHNKIWNGTSEIIQVTDGIYVGIGFSLANVIIIETNQSLIIIHTTESISAALDIRKSFNESTPKSTHSKPISTIIYTHYQVSMLMVLVDNYGDFLSVDKDCYNKWLFILYYGSFNIIYNFIINFYHYFLYQVCSLYKSKSHCGVAGLP